jgi:hypothetical protein
LKFVTTSNVGLPVQLDAVLTTHTHNPIQPNPSRITLPLDPPLTPFAPPVTTWDTLEIQDLINDHLQGLPYRVGYDVMAIANPKADPTIPNFFSRDAFIKTAVSAEIPMRLRVKQLSISDTISFAGLPFSDGVESFMIKANLHNAFPMDAEVFLYLLNAEYQVIDSVKISKIAAAKVNPATMRVIESTHSLVDISLTEQQVKHLVDTRFFLIKGVMNTSNNGETLVGIYENSETEGFLKVLLGCRLRVSGNILDTITDFLGGGEDDK